MMVVHLQNKNIMIKTKIWNDPWKWVEYFEEILTVFKVENER
jgi:hypothetical protein